MQYGAPNTAPMPRPGSSHHPTHHSGFVRKVTITDYAVEVTLETSPNVEPMAVAFTYAFDPLLAERAATLIEGQAAAVSCIAWTDGDGATPTRQGRGLSD
ncbi:MAG: hypothetical protein ACR2NG_00600 [Acidimicrobiia bacterium]